MTAAGRRGAPAVAREVRAVANGVATAVSSMCGHLLTAGFGLLKERL
ncbi:hypothetical protein HEK616_26410 [Streptomyces nigrescens]|uniref:Uncharacterized protein n=1 Tax=Streptomyces nigrescens TaxID=1920 RepID=A0ABM7ZSC2_STRNI|nr:hypothetical protein HEK616_26410 [Streptomyces nigrescens]